MMTIPCKINSLLTKIKEFFKLSFLPLLELIFFKLFRMINMGLYIKTYSNTDAKGKIVQYLGSYHGKVLILTGLLGLIILSITGKNLQRIGKCYHRNRLNLSWQYLCNDLKQMLFLAVPAMILTALPAKNLLTLLYKSTGNIEVSMLQIGSINILLIPLAVYLYKLISNLDLKIIEIIIPMISFIIQTIVMGILVKQEALGALSLIISDVVFWFLIVLFELLVVIKTIKLPLIKNKDV